MRAESALALAAGAGVAAIAALAGFVRLRIALGRGDPLAPQVLLQATALRFALTLAGAVALALGWRSEAAAALAGVGGVYLALLVVETRWATGRLARTGVATGDRAQPNGAPRPGEE